MVFPSLSWHPRQIQRQMNTRGWTVPEPMHHRRGSQWPLYHQYAGHDHADDDTEKDVSNHGPCMQKPLEKPAHCLRGLDLNSPGKVTERNSPDRASKSFVCSGVGALQPLGKTLKEVVAPIFLSSIVLLSKSITAPTCLSWDTGVRRGHRGLLTTVYFTMPLTPPIPEGISAFPNTLALPPMPTAWLSLQMTRALSPNFLKRASSAFRNGRRSMTPLCAAMGCHSSLPKWCVVAGLPELWNASGPNGSFILSRMRSREVLLDSHGMADPECTSNFRRALLMVFLSSISSG